MKIKYHDGSEEPVPATKLTKHLAVYQDGIGYKILHIPSCRVLTQCQFEKSLAIYLAKKAEELLQLDQNHATIKTTAIASEKRNIFLFSQMLTKLHNYPTLVTKRVFSNLLKEIKSDNNII